MVECFSSIQGEGVLVGMRQAFLRFSGCNLHCSFCDTPGMTGAPEECLLELTPGRRDFESVPNPVGGDRLCSLIESWTSRFPAVHHSISVTGGEPLLHPDFLSELLPRLRRFLPIHLETNGTLHQNLSELLPHLDYVGMDIKLPSASGCLDLWDEHRLFLQMAARTGVYVKVVVGGNSEDWEIERCSSLIEQVDPAIPLILQPMTLPDGSLALSPFRMLEMQELCHRLKEVRVIPQTHKFMGQL